MKQLLIIIITCTTFVCYTSDSNKRRLTKKERELEKQFAVYDTLARSRGKELLALVQQHDFLRAARVIGDSVILRSIRSDGSADNPYPTRNIQKLLETGVDIDQAGTGGRTALMEIAVGGRLFCAPIVQGLLEQKADPTKRDINGYNALGIALSSGRSDKNVLLLASHPKIAAVINEPIYVHTRWKTPLNALITTDNASCIYRQETIESVLDAGAHISVQDICDSLEPDRAHDTILKRCSLALLTQVFPLVENHTYHSPLIKFSKKEVLCKAIKDKIDEQMPNLATPAVEPAIQFALQDVKQSSDK